MKMNEKEFDFKKRFAVGSSDNNIRAILAEIAWQLHRINGQLYLMRNFDTREDLNNERKG